MCDKGKEINLNFTDCLQLGDDLQDAIFFFGMSNSLVNPLIYGAFHLCPGKGGKSSGGGGNNNAYSLNRWVVSQQNKLIILTTTFRTCFCAFIVSKNSYFSLKQYTFKTAKQAFEVWIAAFLIKEFLFLVIFHIKEYKW